MFMQRAFLIGAVLPAVAIGVTACGQSGSEQQQAIKTEAVEQTVAIQAGWDTLTKQADEALKSGDKQTAEKLYKDAIVAAAALGAEGAEVGAATTNLANFYYAQGDGEQANRLFTKSLAIKEKVLGLEHKDIATDLVGLGRISVANGDKAKAKTYYERAIAIYKKVGEPVPADVEKEYAALGTT